MRFIIEALAMIEKATCSLIDKKNFKRENQLGRPVCVKRINI